jgi:predicted transcriptional regulator
MEPPKRGRPRGRKVGETIAVRLPPDVDNALRRIAEREDRPLAGIVRQALRSYLAEELASAS